MNTLMLCVKRNNWEHTSVAKHLKNNENGTVSYGLSNVEYDAVLTYCWLDDDELRKKNLLSLSNSSVRSWPTSQTLTLYDDRHEKLKFAAEHGLVDDVEFVSYEELTCVAERDLVLKVGNSHGGVGKLLVKKGERFPSFQGVASLEPFVEGASVRVYVVDGKPVGCVEYLNELTWIKNDAGCDVVDYFCSKRLEKHAVEAHELHQGLDISASDYIVRSDGSFRFLEHNHFPGIAISSSAKDAILEKLSNIMDELEE